MAINLINCRHRGGIAMTNNGCVANFLEFAMAIESDFGATTTKVRMAHVVGW